MLRYNTGKGQCMKDDSSTSKFLSLILRHRPEVIGITLDNHGWADVREVIDGISKSRPFSMEILERIVANDAKQRYSFNEDHTRIRANQGHSIPVDVELEQCEPPEVLYHGTGEKYVPSIRQQGLVSKTRLYVHLSTDTATARAVGQRHGRPAVFLVLAGEMARSGIPFYRSRNGVWLTEAVPVKYLKQIS